VNFGVFEVFIKILLMLIVIGLFIIGFRLNDLVHLLVKIEKNSRALPKCDEKLEIIMLKGMSDE